MKNVRHVALSLFISVLILAAGVLISLQPISASASNLCALQAATVNGQFACLNQACKTDVCCLATCPEGNKPQATKKT